MIAETTEGQAMDDRLALFGVLQELTVAALDLFDPTRSLDDVLQTIAARLGCRVALCLEAAGGGQVTLRGAAGLARTSLDLPLPPATEGRDQTAMPLPYPEVAAPTLVRWLVQPEGERPRLASQQWWLLFYFEREPRMPRQYRGMLTRLAHHLDLAFEHRRLNETLERRVADRTAQLAATNGELVASIEALSRTQEQLLQAGKLAAVGQLAAGVAHEINNPLAVILGFAQGLERRLVAANDPQSLPITSIVREALRCKSLIQELLTFSRVGKKTAEDVDPNALLKSAGQLLELRARPQNTRIELELDEQVGRIRANGSQLQQVLVNLGNNALDALRQGGSVRLRSGRAGQWVFVEVQDTGPGMSNEVRARIFEPFFTTKEVGKGTGLGLSLAYEIVQQHGGRIEVLSELGRGTTMTVRLPREQPAPAATRTSDGHTPRDSTS